MSSVKVVKEDRNVGVADSEPVEGSLGDLTITDPGTAAAGAKEELDFQDLKISLNFRTL
jgi:hypothetical protein